MPPRHAFVPRYAFVYFYHNYISCDNKTQYFLTILYKNSTNTVEQASQYAPQGNDSYPDKLELKLSDAFETPDTSSQFEWTATMLNINQGHNPEIMDKCQALFQYSDFNAKVKEYKRSMSIEDAFNEDVFRKGIHEEGYNDGFSDGFNEAMITFIHNLPNSDTKETVIVQLMKCFNLSESTATTLVNEHWK